MDSQHAVDFAPHSGDADFGHSAPLQTLGQRLRAAREAAGMSLADVSENTRVPERMLVSIEAGAYEALPAPTFTGGFIRSFAREVGLSEAEAAAQYRTENTRVVPAPLPVSMRPIEPQRVPSRQLAWASAAVAALAVVGVTIYFATRDHHASAPTAVPSAAPATIVAPAPVAPASVSANNVGPVSPSTAATPGSTGATIPPVADAVTLTATQDAWVQVRDRITHARVMSGVLAQGQTYTVPTGNYTLSTGRAGALQVKVGGRPLPSLGGPVDILHDVSLDAASLSARGASAAAAGSPPGTAPAQSPTG